MTIYIYNGACINVTTVCMYVRTYTCVCMRIVVCLIFMCSPFPTDDATRVHLREGPDYINANFVNVRVYQFDYCMLLVLHRSLLFSLSLSLSPPLTLPFSLPPSLPPSLSPSLPPSQLRWKLKPQVR